jgi:hypothetical protein
MELKLNLLPVPLLAVEAVAKKASTSIKAYQTF